MLDHYLHAAWTAAMAINPSWQAPELVAATAAVSSEIMADAVEATAWLTAEHQVLMRIVEYAAQSGSDRHAWQLSWALTDYLDRGGHWPDFAASQRVALAAAERAGDRLAQARAQRYLGRASFALHELDAAHDHFSRALLLRHELGDPAGETGVRIDLCRVHEARGDIAQALAEAGHSLRASRADGDRAAEAIAVNAVAWYSALNGDFTEALLQGRRAVELAEQVDQPLMRAHAYDSVGYVHQRTGSPAESIAWYQRAIETYVRLGDCYSTARGLTHLGDALDATGDLLAANRAWREAQAILDDLEHPDGDLLRRKLARIGDSVGGQAG